jgi:hypothetical protein
MRIMTRPLPDLPENTSDVGMDVIVVELKGHAAKP